MQYEDFSPNCQELPQEFATLAKSAKCLNIGWIGAERDFPTEVADAQFLSQLWAACRDSTFQIKTFFRCLQCQSMYGPLPAELGSEKVNLGDGFVVVEQKPGVLLLAPNLIYHYVAAHHYSPPAEFKNCIMEGRIFRAVPFEVILKDQVDRLTRYAEWVKAEELRGERPTLWLSIVASLKKLRNKGIRKRDKLK